MFDLPWLALHYYSNEQTSTYDLHIIFLYLKYLLYYW
jgi:hypothetical protein